jgi:hypothetical protein
MRNIHEESSSYNNLLYIYLIINLMNTKIEYSGKVYLYSSGMPLELLDLAKSKLVKEHNVLSEDIVFIEVPEGVPEGAVMVTIWPHYLSVSKVKRVRDGSIYAPQLFNIDL